MCSASAGCEADTWLEYEYEYELPDSDNSSGSHVGWRGVAATGGAAAGGSASTDGTSEIWLSVFELPDTE